MNPRTFLSIYQTYSLEKISALSKQGLAMQYAQCEQLVKLKNEMAANMMATNKILQNQIKELERQEEQRYFKSLTFNTKKALEIIEQQENTNFKSFLRELFLPALKSYAKQAMDVLEEIHDKEYANSILKRIQSIDLSSSKNTTYNNSPWQLFLQIQRIQNDSQLNKKLCEKQAELSEANARLKKETSKLSTYKTAKGCFLITCIPLAFTLLGLFFMLINKDYEVISGGVICLLISLAVFSLGLYWKNKYKKYNNTHYKSEEHKKYAELVSNLEDEICDINREMTNKQIEYNECLQAITLDVPDWEKTFNDIVNCIPPINS